jgi:ubiquinone/menaquinone biosynthesis C-methylase UbiE
VLRLNLASGTDIRDGWHNLDAVAWPMARRPPDVFWEAHQPLPYADNVVDEIYAGYLFLHVEPTRHAGLLAEIRRVMKPGAVLVVGEVDMAILLPRWLANPSDGYLSGLVWGEQGSEHGAALATWDKHNQGFTEESLRAFLSRGGFKSITRVNVHGPLVWYELSLATHKE